MCVCACPCRIHPLVDTLEKCNLPFRMVSALGRPRSIERMQSIYAGETRTLLLPNSLASRGGPAVSHPPRFLIVSRFHRFQLFHVSSSFAKFHRSKLSTRIIFYPTLSRSLPTPHPPSSHFPIDSSLR